MIGSFLEIGFAAQPISAAFECYRSLGFRTVPVADILEHPYAVVFDGHVCIGLHARSLEGPSLTFVRPGLRDYVRALKRVPVDIEFSHLGDDEFNAVGFRDPNGQLVTLVEARTFSPASWEGARCACGEFLEFSCPTASAAASEDYWRKLGFSTVARGESPHPWVRLRGHGLTLGLHESLQLTPGVTYTASSLGARIEYLRANGVEVVERSPMDEPGAATATLLVPGSACMILLDGGTVASAPR